MKEENFYSIKVGSITICGVLSNGKIQWVTHGGKIIKSQSEAEAYARRLDSLLSDDRPRVVRSKKALPEYDYYSRK